MGVHPIERDVFLFLNGLNFSLLNPVMVFFSSFLPWIPLSVILMWIVTKKLGRKSFFPVFILALLLLAVVDTSTSHIFKIFFQRLRPCRMPEFDSLINNFGQRCGGKYGFFSSHAANSMALTYFLMGFVKDQKRICFTVYFIVFLVAYSRIYLAVHFPLDIIVGILWGASIAHAWRWVARHSPMVPSAP
ncbi:MAG: phosphatase PAP2 family protein [Bacteriovoracaceae bacterium]|nr:phosphatase PAP2 family protein [Bacteriovoracaceae bacterium]